MLLPESLQEWLPEGHLAHFISDAIDGLDLGAFHARNDKGGPRNEPFHPGMMVKVLVYGYAAGVFSSRKIARKLHEDVAFRVLETQVARAAYRRRKWLAEPPNGWIKNVLGFRQFSVRGLHRVQAEWKLVCVALNLRRMATMQAG